MAGVNPVSSSTTGGANSNTQSTSVQYGYNTPPVSFAGIASGIDYTQIINQLTAETTAGSTAAQTQVTQLNNENNELVKINGLLLSVQNTLATLQNPNNFSTFLGTSTDSTVATATGIPGTSATPGTYTVQVNNLATATQTVAEADTNVYNALDPSKAFNSTTGGYGVTLLTGSTTQGKITVDGVQLSYSAGESLDQFITSINTNATLSSYGVLASVSSAGVFSLSSGTQPLSLGSPTDTGNIEQVLKIDQAQIVNGASSGSVTGTSSVNGLNAQVNLNVSNAKVPVTTGSFTINGVAISVNAGTQSLDDIINEINSSNAGVSAAYNSATNQLTLTNTNLGPQSIVLGAPGDSSNFLKAVGVTTSGAVTTVGSQSSVTVTNPFGQTQTVYGGSNAVTNAITGISLNLSGVGVTNINVSQDTSTLVSSINNFVSAYNAAISEINTATAPPVVNSQSITLSNVGAPQTSQQQTGALTSGGILYGDSTVAGVKDQLVSLISQVFQTGSGSYNSLSSIGLQLDSNFTQLTQQNNSSTSSSGGTTTSSADTAFTEQGGLTSTTFDGTSGQLQALDLTTFNTAFNADPSAISNLLSGNLGLPTALGAYLTGVTGSPTQLSTGFVGTIPDTSLLLNDENANSGIITSLQQQIATITDQANMQADNLRAQFVNSETLISQYTSIQSQLSSLFKG